MIGDNSKIAGIPSEPDLNTALSWYPEMQNQYVPLGWKNHFYEFMLLWNGDIITPTAFRLKKYLERNLTEDAQFCFFWKLPGDRTIFSDKNHDHSPVTREYIDGWKPAARLTHFHRGLEIVETAFAHMPNPNVETGDEPMYLWVGFDIRKAVEILVPEDEVTLHVQISANRLVTNMCSGASSRNVDLPKDYAHDLHISGNHLVQDDGKIRLSVVNGDGVDISFAAVWKEVVSHNKYRKKAMTIKIPLKDGKAHLEMLIPYLPGEKDQVEAEIARGYENSLQDTMSYWYNEANVGVKCTIPEKMVENIFRSFPWIMQVIAEKNLVFGDYAINNGAMVYDAVCATPASLTNVWGFDYMGYHEDADRCLEMFRKEQGKVNPPGDYYIPHHGFLCSPDRYSLIRWVTEHGAILWSAAEHYLLTRDEEFLERWLPAMLSACEWIQVQLRNEDHPGIKGLLPCGVANDDYVNGQLIWNDGWMYKGLSTAARVFEEIGHPQASKWREETQAYKRRFNEVYLKTCGETPEWTSEDGVPHHFIPLDAEGVLWVKNRNDYYLDCGPLFLAFTGLIDHDNYIYDSTLLWLREGPQVKYWRMDGACTQVPILYHEMSSFEPCYSWNMFVNFQRGDRARFIEGLYSLIAGSRTTDLFSDVETRNGVFATNFSTPVTFYHFRNGLIYENGNTLELMKMVPAAWMKPGDVLELKDAPTYFGRMSIRASMDTEGKELDICIDLPKVRRPESVVLFNPMPEKFDRVFVNGKESCINGGKIDISHFPGMVSIKCIKDC